MASNLIVGLERSSSDATRLVEPRNDEHVLTAHRETDVRTAITRGLKEYLQQLVIDWPGGRRSAFAYVTDVWADPEVEAEYPSAAVWSNMPGRYDSDSFTPRTLLVDGGFAIRKVSEFMQTVNVEVFAADVEERMALVAMLEDAFDPQDDMYGFVLELQHYHNARALFEKTELDYADSEESAGQRRRNAVVTLTAVCPQYRLTGPARFIDVRVDAGDQEGGLGEVGPDVAI